MVINKDFKKFIELLNENGVKYLVIGGYAVNFHGYPRYTKDIDFWVWLNEANVKNLLRALDAFGFGSLGLSAEDFMNPTNVVQLGQAPYRIDILSEVEGATFEECFERKRQIEIADTFINFMGIEDLIKAKVGAGRPQDLADAAQLSKLKDKNKLTH
jgi:predicted nucleotidyltransferase